MQPSDSLWIPNADQQRVIETVSGLCTVIAGPGTGKTATLAAKTGAIISQGGRPLAVTYTRAAAQELLQRLSARHIQATACTCHSLAFKIFSRLAFSRPAPRLLDSHKHEREAILRQVLQRLTHSQHASPDRLPSLQELGERVSRVKTAGPCTPDDADLLALYEEAKGSDRIDFQDLLILTTQLLTEQPDVLHGYQHTYTHILVDEAQDLDLLQARFLALFVPPHNALTVFLDPDQAIYSYAGADPDTTLSLFNGLIPRTQIALRPSYRSRAPIIQCALSLIEHNPNGHHSRHLMPIREGRVRPHWIRVRSQAEEACLVARAIQNVLREGIPPTDILCLFRANPYRVMLEVALTEAGIPFGLVHSAQQQHPTYLEYGVLPLTALLLLTTHGNAPSWAEEAALRIYVGSQLSVQLARRGAVSLDSAARSLGERPARRVCAYLQDLADLRACQHLPPPTLGDIAHSILSRVSQRPADNPGVLAAARRALSLFPSLSTFAAHMERLQALQLLPAHDRVSLSTIHRAKGRQSRIVFLLGASEGIFPSRHAGTDIEEERRVCFVGSTRAKDAFLISSPRMMGGHAARPSRFIREGGFPRLFLPTVGRLTRQLKRV